MCHILKKLLEFQGHKNEFDISQAEYLHIMKTVRQFTKGISKPEDTLIAFDYMLFIFRTEYAAKTRTRLFRWNVPTPIGYILPGFYCTEDGIKHSLACCGQEEVQLNENIAVAAWRQDRLQRILPVIEKKKFTEDLNNHIAFYYPELGLVTVTSGNHSASAGVFLKSGNIHADVYHISDMFEHVATDGINWINKHTGEKLMNVAEPYIAILYEIAQAKYEFQKGQSGST